MSSKSDTNAVSTNGDKGDKIVIRYSQEFLLACAKSPLVERPAALPPTSVWFGEIVKEEQEFSNPPRKNNNSKSMSDRIVLGPPKMSFASSSLGGMKRSDDGLSGFKKALDTPRETRTPRGPPSALEHGFGRDTIEKLSSHKLLPKVTPKDITGLLSGMDRRRPDASRSGSGLTGSRQSSTTSGTTSKFGSSSKPAGQFLSTPNPLLSNTGSNGNGSGGTGGIGGGNGSGFASRTQQRSDAPEWMNYNPDSEGTKDEEGGEGPQAFVDDIQAWKARMKEHERREREKENGGPVRDRPDSKAPSRADSSSSWRSPNVQSGQVDQSEDDKTALDKDLLGMGKSVRSLHLTNEPIQDIDMFFSPGAIDLTKPFESTSAFDKFFSQHTSSAAAMEDSAHIKPARKVDGSRFARFFAEDEPEPVKESGQGSQMLGEQPGKQLSLDQLFRSHAPTASSAAPPPPLGRMPSEAEILQSMTAAKSPVSPTRSENDSRSEDAFAFQKIMAALSKAPVGNSSPSTPLSSTSSQPMSHAPSSAEEPTLETSGATALQDPSIIAIQTKPAPVDTPTKAPAVDSRTSSFQPPLTNGEQPQEFAPTSTTTPVTTAAITSPTPSTSSDTRPASRPVQVAFGGGIPTSVYRQLSGKTDGQKTGSPLIRPLSVSNSNGTSVNGGASPSLSSPSIHSPRQFNAQTSVPSQQPVSISQQQPPQPPQPHQPMHQPHMNKNFGPYTQGPGMHSPVMDPRLGMYPNNGPSPVGVHNHLMENEPPFFNGVPMQRPTQDMPPQFGQQMPFSQQMHVSGPGDFMPPHPSQFVGMPPPFGGHPMHPGMFPMNPVEMLMHRGPGGPPRPMPGMGPGPGPNHFVPNNYGHPMSGMPHQGMPMNPQFFPPQVSKPMMSREEFERRNRQQ